MMRILDQWNNKDVEETFKNNSVWAWCDKKAKSMWTRLSYSLLHLQPRKKEILTLQKTKVCLCLSAVSNITIKPDLCRNGSSSLVKKTLTGRYRGRSSTPSNLWEELEHRQKYSNLRSKVFPEEWRLLKQQIKTTEADYFAACYLKNMFDITCWGLIRSNIVQVKAQKELLFAHFTSFYNFSAIHGDGAGSLGFLHTQHFFAELQQKGQ